MADTTIEFENDRVRVSRVKQEGAGVQEPAARKDRVIVYLKDSEIARHAGGQSNVLHRRAGDVVWQDASEHTIEVTAQEPHEVLIVELKN
jgi:hypothetical protein